MLYKCLDPFNSVFHHVTADADENMLCIRVQPDKTGLHLFVEGFKIEISGHANDARLLKIRYEPASNFVLICSTSVMYFIMFCLSAAGFS